jgi:ribonuclease P protein component
VKRRLRELVRTRLLPLDTAADIVIRIRPEAYGAAFATLVSDFDRLLGQLTQWRAIVPDVPPPGRTGGRTTSDDT